jgi:hypothetical protein
MGLTQGRGILTCGEKWQKANEFLVSGDEVDGDTEGICWFSAEVYGKRYETSVVPFPSFLYKSTTRLSKVVLLMTRLGHRVVVIDRFFAAGSNSNWSARPCWRKPNFYPFFVGCGVCGFVLGGGISMSVSFRLCYPFMIDVAPMGMPVGVLRHWRIAWTGWKILEGGQVGHWKLGMKLDLPPAAHAQTSKRRRHSATSAFSPPSHANAILFTLYLIVLEFLRKVTCTKSNV